MPSTNTLGGSKNCAWLGLGTESWTALHAAAPIGTLQKFSVVSAGCSSQTAYNAPAESTATAGIDGSPVLLGPIAIGFASADAVPAKTANNAHTAAHTPRDDRTTRS